jgi:hypothetical protein
MASPVNAALCALIATAFWVFLGYAIGRHLFPRVLAIAGAAVIGWAAHSAVLLPIFTLIGFSQTTVVVSGLICLLAAGFSLSRPSPISEAEGDLAVPPWAFAAAASLALVPAVAILPKFSGDAAQLADPIFDHAKAALIDTMARLGLPPVNPVFGQIGTSDRLAYYYLWHFSAAEVALTLGASGWEADIGSTWFTAFASLCLMMGLAVWLSKLPVAAVWVVALAAAASLWVTLFWIFRTEDFRPVLWPSIGMSGWLFQATWAPQHLMAGSCVVAAMLLMTSYARRPSLTLVLMLAIVIVAGFESSTFVGGVTFAIAGLVAAPILFNATFQGRRLRFLAGLAVAALLVVCLIAPFLRDQFATVVARGRGSPLAIEHYTVFGEAFPYWLRRIVDVPGYWLIILPVELPAIYVAGLIAFPIALRHWRNGPEKLAIIMFACLAGAGLLTSWLFVSTLGENNDLGLRAIIPAEIVLIVIVAAVLTSMPSRATLIAAVAGLVLSLPDTATMIHDNVVGTARPDGKIFARAPEIWAAVRRYAAPSVRVANNPLFLKDVTPWPVNISWALLANRNSCFANRDLAAAYAPLSPARLEAINAQFVRVFAGEGTPGDVHEMAAISDCEVVLVVPQDGAWRNDPFAPSPDYRLGESRDDRWRIYVRRR